MIHCIGKILLDIFEERRGGSVELSSKVGGAPFNVAANIALNGGKSSFYGAKAVSHYGALPSIDG